MSCESRKTNDFLSAVVNKDKTANLSVHMRALAPSFPTLHHRPGRQLACAASPQREAWAAWPAARSFVQTATVAGVAGAAGVPALAAALHATPNTLGPDGCACAALAVEVAAGAGVVALLASRDDTAAPLFRLDGAAAAWGVGGALAAGVTVTAATSLLAAPDSAATDAAVGVLRSASPAGAAALVAASGAAAPVLEETIYRGIALAGLVDGGVAAPAAVALSAALFAASHGAVAPADLPPLLALGAVLSLVWLASGGNTAASSLAHGLYNVGVLAVSVSAGSAAGPWR